MEVSLLKLIPLFSGLSNEEIDTILKLAFIQDYDQGTLLFSEGMSGGVMYVILDGEVSISKKIDGQNTEVALLKTNSYFGEMSLIEAAEPRSATARVATKSKLLVITKNCFDKMMHTDPAITSKLLLIFLVTASKRLREATQKNAEMIKS